MCHVEPLGSLAEASILILILIVSYILCVPRRTLGFVMVIDSTLIVIVSYMLRAAGTASGQHAH